MPADAAAVHSAPVARTGITGLDEVLRGGFPAGHVYLIEGVPGAGKTTLALHFALEGVKQGERVLYLTLSETLEELAKAAATHGWSLEGIEVEEVLSAAQLLDGGIEATMFHPSEIELSDTTKQIVAAVDRVKPSRVVFDSLTEIRLQAQTSLRYRREMLALRKLLTGRKCTALLLDELHSEITAQSVVHGIVEMQRETPDFGPARRRLQVAKLRGVPFWEGHHDLVIGRAGLEVYPRLVAAEHRLGLDLEPVASGIPELDQLTGGGLPCGSATLLAGPAGSGKTTVALQFVVAAAGRGHRAAVFSFDETTASYFARARGMGFDLEHHIQQGRIRFQQVDPGELSPGRFVHIIRRAVEEQEVKILVIDSLNGYINAMPNERLLMIQLHELVTYLNQRGVLTLLVLSQVGIINAVESPVDASYLTDNVLLFRHFEAAGEVRHAVSMVKKRSGPHEKTIRELRLTSSGIELGEPLREFRGVLTGVPVFHGTPTNLLGEPGP